jgi:hypothetical protein
VVGPGRGEYIKSQFDSLLTGRERSFGRCMFLVWPLFLASTRKRKSQGMQGTKNLDPLPARHNVRTQAEGGKV